MTMGQKLTQMQLMQETHDAVTVDRRMRKLMQNPMNVELFLAPAQPLKDRAVNQPVAKCFLQFRTEPYKGLVTEYDAVDGFYTVVYEDGDWEHLTWQELVEAAHLEQQRQTKGGNKQQQQQPQQAARKRGRAEATGSSNLQEKEEEQQQQPLPSVPSPPAATVEDARQSGSAGLRRSASRVSTTANQLSSRSSSPAPGAADAGPAAAAERPAAAAAVAGARAAGLPPTGHKTKTKRRASEVATAEIAAPLMPGNATAAGPAAGSADAEAATAAPAAKRQRKKASAVAAGDGDGADVTDHTATDTQQQAKQQKKQKQQKQAVASAAPADATTGKPSTKKPKASSQKTQAAAAGGNAAAAAAAGDNAADAVGPNDQDDIDGQASAGASSTKVGKGKVQRVQISLETYTPAQVLEEAWRRREAAAVADLAAVGAAAVAAAEVVMAPKGNKPMFALEERELKMLNSDGAVQKHLEETAVRFSPGKEPFRRFVLDTAKMQEAANAASAAKTAAPPASKGRAASGKKAAGVGSSSTHNSSAATAEAAVEAAVGDGKWKDVALAAAKNKHKVLFVADEPFVDPELKLALALHAADKDFWAEYRRKTVSEAERVEEERRKNAEILAQNPKAAVTKPSQRPDRAAESALMAAGKLVNDRDSWGHVPAITVNFKGSLRSQLSILGAHKSPLGGIVTGTIPVPIEVAGQTYKNVKAATSIVIGGIYETDKDAHGHDVILQYTGAGGNDLLGNKQQMKDQQLTSSNRALLANIALGLPVRVFRRNDDDSSATSSVIYYDGLYDVVSIAKRKSPNGYVVFVYGIRRRPGQAQSESKPIDRFKGVGTAKRGVALHMRQHLNCTDVSKGCEGDVPVVAVNEVDRYLPPGLSLSDPEDKKYIRNDDPDKPLLEDPLCFTYIRDNVYDSAVKEPQAPKVVDEGTEEAAAAETAIREAAQAGSTNGCGTCVAGALWNSDYVIRKRGESPHELLARINGGHLPWKVPEGAAGEEQGGGAVGASRKSAKQKGVPVARELMRVLVECGSWTGCQDDNCRQRQSKQPLQYRLEIFKTKGCGWGVRSWDNITAGSLVCIMVGKIFRAEDVGDGKKYEESEYFFSMTPRSDFGCDGKELPRGRALDLHSRFVLCARDQGGVARFINHSCKPNLYVQPICSGHTDTDHVLVGLFAMENIPQFTQLSYDYGEEYIQHNLAGQCKCGADVCISKRQQPAGQLEGQQAAAAGAAARADMDHQQQEQHTSDP